MKGELRPRAMAVSSSSIGDTDVGILPCRPQVKQIWTLFHENLYLDTVSTASSGPPDQELTVFQVLVGHDGGDGAIAKLATTFWLSRTFDTAGEVLAGYAAGASAISRANGVIRVLTRAVSRNHSPSRSAFSPTAVKMCPKRTRARPI